MARSKSAFALCFFSFVVCGNARADLWSLDRVLETVEDNNYLVAKANSRIAEMKDSKNVAIGGYFPALGLQSTFSSNEFVLSQKLYDGGASIAQIELADHRTRIAEVEKTMQMQRIRTAAIGAYYDAVFAKERRVFYEKNAVSAAAALEKSQTQYKYRAIGHDAMLRAKIYFRRNNSEVFEAQREETTALRALSRITRIPDFSAEWLPAPPATSDLPKPPSSESNHQIDTIFPNLPEVSFLQASKKALNAEKKYEMSIDMPSLSFLASYGLGQQAPAMSVNYVYAVGLQFGFTLTIPFFSGYSIHSRQKMFAEREFQYDQDIHVAKDDFTFEYKERLSVLQKGWSDLQYIRDELKASEDIWKESDANFKIGLTLPDIWFESSENLMQWKLRELQEAKNYLIQNQILTDLTRTM